MNDDWKWVLRSTMTTRPVLRFTPDLIPDQPAQHQQTALFSDTKGLFRVSSGEVSPFASAASQPDLGTTFALATSLFGSNQLQVSGNIGYAAHSEMPVAGFRTSFSRPQAGGPEVKVMMQQVSLPMRGTPVLNSTQSASAPALRTMSVTMLERSQISDGIELAYGASLDSVAFLDRLNYVSPFARLSYRLGENGVLDVGYSSGAPPVELLNATDGADSFESDVAALAVLPRVSLRGGRARVQRTQNVEIGYKLQSGTRTYNVGFFHESVTNGVLTMALPEGLYYSGDVLPELSSRSSAFNIGAYTRSGYTASVTQALGGSLAATIAAGRGGVLLADGRVLQSNDPDELRDAIKPGQRFWLRGKVAGTAPVTGTKYVASYEWTDQNSLVPAHVYLTQRIYPETGLNIRIHQPLPGFGIWPGRLEASAELRNMLAQGYLPIALADNRRLILAHSPRSVRGGVSFIF